MDRRAFGVALGRTALVRAEIPLHRLDGCGQGQGRWILLKKLTEPNRTTTGTSLSLSLYGCEDMFSNSVQIILAREAKCHRLLNTWTQHTNNSIHQQRRVGKAKVTSYKLSQFQGDRFNFVKQRPLFPGGSTSS